MSLTWPLLPARDSACLFRSVRLHWPGSFRTGDHRPGGEAAYGRAELGASASACVVPVPMCSPQSSIQVPTLVDEKALRGGGFFSLENCSPRECDLGLRPTTVSGHC